MVLRGDVQSLNLPSILQNLAADEKTGTLTLEREETRVHIWLEKGAIRLIGFGDETGPSILAGLLALDLIPYDELDLPRRRVTRRGRLTLVNRVVRKYGLTPQDVTDALTHQMIEHLCEALLWSEATYEFAGGQPSDERFDPGQLKAGVHLVAEAMVIEAIRRGDEWQELCKVVGSATDVLVPEHSEVDPDADATVARVFALVDGHATVNEIIESTRLGAFAVYKALARLLRDGAVASLTCAQAVEWAHECDEEGDWDGVLHYCRFALAHEPNHVELLQLAARANQELERTREAIACYRHLGTLCAEHGDPENALDALRSIVALAPDDLLAHERTLELLLTLGRQGDALEAIAGMTAAAEHAGLPDKLPPIYTRLLESIGEDETLLSALADVERNLGKTADAVALYLRLLRPTLLRGDEDEALELCETILQLDPDQEQVERTRERIRSGLEQKAREHRRLRKLLIPLALVLMGVAVAVGYEVTARIDLAGQREDILRATIDSRHSEVLRLYDGFVADWPLSLAARELRADRSRLEPIFVRASDERAERLRTHGDLTNAVATMREAARLAQRTDLRVRVAKRLGELEAELARAVAARSGEIEALAGRIRNSDSSAAAALAAVSDAIAVPGLRHCLGDPDVRVRRSAVMALGSTRTSAALHALVEALADPEASIRSLAIGHLSQRSREDYGQDRLAWDRWVRMHDRSQSSTAVQTALEPAATRVQAGHPLVVSWRVENMTASAQELGVRDPAGGLQVSGPHGPLRVEHRDTGLRAARLYTGEFLGGAFDIAALCPDLRGPGRYRVEWRATITIDGVEHATEAAPVTIEVVE